MIRRFVTENLWWKLLSLLIAFVMWVGVAREPELATSISVPVLFRNLPDDLDIASDVPERVQLEVRGPAPRLSTASLARTAVILDLTALQPGERTFNIESWNIRQLPIGVAFYRAVPSQVSLRFEHLLSKEVPIEPSYAKAPPDGYFVQSYTITPTSVRIRGPESRVVNIDHVMTDPIDLTGVVGMTSKHARVRVGDPQVRLESKPDIRFVAELQKSTTKDQR